MRKGVLTAAGLALVAAVSWSSAPAQAVPLSAAKALNVAADGFDATSKVHCWDRCGYYHRPRYRPHWRPYRPYYSHYRSYHRPYYRPYYRSYYRHRPYYRPYHAGYGFRQPWWL